MTPRIYGKPKIHKKDIPLRPIVSVIGAPHHPLSHFLTTKLKPFVSTYVYLIKDSSHFIQKPETIHLDPNDIMVSFDVVSLFTKIPILEPL